MKRIPFYIIATSLLSGCNTYSNYNRPEGLPVDSIYNESTLAQADSLTSLGFMPWRELFTDTCLQNLIQEGLDYNSDLQIAMLRIDEAKAGLNAAKLAYLPSLTFSPNGSITSVDGGKASKIYELPFSLSWEIDLFGKLHNAKKEQQMLLLSQQAYAGAVKSELISTIANSYYALLMLDSQIEISNQTIDVWREQLRTMELQLKVGAIRENAVSQAKANLEG